MQALLALSLLTVLPGLGLATSLHPQGDRVQRWCAAPALGLAALAFAFGTLVLLGLWSFWVAILVTVLLQAWGLLTLRRAPSPSVSERDAWFRAQRAQPRMWLGGLIALLALLPVLVADTPQGVDWVGFTALAHHLAERGAFVSASGHSWLYPPGLPAMLAFLAGITGLPLPSVGLAVGQFTLVALLLGMCSALDRHGAGGEGILAMMLAVGVFSKVLDSGWPTVLSLTLIPFNLGGLLEVDGPRSEKRLTLLLSAVASAILHPVGALLLLLLLVADVASHGLAKGPLDRFRLDIGVLIGLVLLLVGVALLSQDVRLDAPFAEDGWQGGWPMLAYGSPLLFLAAWAGWRLRGYRESRLLVMWLLLTWGLSLVQLLPDGARGAALTNLGSGLYAMGMYAFHLPAVALVALWWSDSTALRGAEASPSFFVVEGDPCPARPVALGLVLVVVIGSLAATGAMARLWVHEETLALAPADIQVAEHLRTLSGEDMVYAEQAPWGEAMVITGLNLTVGVDLGAHDGPTTLHERTTQAVLTDDVATLEDLGVKWAISSPLGALGWVLERSPWWENVHEVSGSRAWALREQPVDDFLGAAVLTEASCAGSCTMRPDPWVEQRWSDPHGLGSSRAVIDAPASSTLSFAWPDAVNDEPVLICLHIERIGPLASGAVDLGLWSADLAGPAGHDRLCGEGVPTGNLNVTLEGGEKPWLDPAGASGRSDRLVGADGLRLHALTLHLPAAKAST